MSIHTTAGVPNVYKLEKFVIIDTVDNFGTQKEQYSSSGFFKLATTKPNYLECFRVYVDLSTDDSGNTVKSEKVDTLRVYNIAVPLNLWQVGGVNLDHDANSLICPPYIATSYGLITSADTDLTLGDLLVGGFIHRSSIIYAQRRDYGIDLYTSSSSNNTRNGEIDQEKWAQYIDVNVDGRALKISSQADKSNGVDMTDAAFQEADSPWNYYDGSITRIEKLQKACFTNEDSALSYLSDIENVTQSGGWQENPTKKYALVVTDVTNGDATVQLQTFTTDDSPATKFDELTDFDGDATAADSLNTTGSTTKEGMLAMVKYGTVADTTPSLGSRQLTLTRLTNRNLATNAENTLSGDAKKIATTKKANLFVASNVDHRDGDTAKSFLMGVELHEMFSNSDEHGIYNHGGAIEKFYEGTVDKSYFLTVEGTAAGVGSTTRFKKFTHLDQIRGVKIYDDHTNSNQITDGESKLVYAKAYGSDTGTHGITFRPSKTNAGLTLGQLKNEQYFLYRETGGKVELMPFPAENIETAIGSGGGGGGNVKWNGGSGASANANGTVVLGADTPHPVDAESNPLNVSETATANVKLTYAPALFGICKDDGSYEYRYFLTSRALTSEELS